MAIYSLFVNITVIEIFIMYDISNRFHPSLSGTKMMTTHAHCIMSLRPSLLPTRSSSLSPRFYIRNEDEPLLSVHFFLFFRNPVVKNDCSTIESLIRTPKGQSEMSVLERCSYKRGHYDDVTFKTPLTGLSVQYIKTQNSVS